MSLAVCPDFFYQVVLGVSGVFIRVCVLGTLDSVPLGGNHGAHLLPRAISRRAAVHDKSHHIKFCSRVPPDGNATGSAGHKEENQDDQEKQMRANALIRGTFV